MLVTVAGSALTVEVKSCRLILLGKCEVSTSCKRGSHGPAFFDLSECIRAKSGNTCLGHYFGPCGFLGEIVITYISPCALLCPP